MKKNEKEQKKPEEERKKKNNDLKNLSVNLNMNLTTENTVYLS